MTEGASNPQARLADMDAMGIDQAFLYPTWFAEGFFLVRDPDTAYALARAYNDWIADFCKAAPDRLFAAAMLPLQDMDFALEELQRVAQMPSFRARLHPPDVSSKTATLTIPLRPAMGGAGEPGPRPRRCIATPGLWNPEWTSHGPFFEKVKDRLGAAAGSRRRRRAVRRRRGGPASRSLSAPQHHWDIRWRRSSPLGSTIICSSPRR